MRRHFSNNRGFTFIELILATVVISTALFGLMTLFQNVVNHGSNTERFITASHLASSKLEEIVADKNERGYTYVVNGNYNINENLTGNFNGFTRTINIFEVQAANLTTPQAGTGYKRVTVSVISPGGGTVAYQTLLTLWGT